MDVLGSDVAADEPHQAHHQLPPIPRPHLDFIGADNSVFQQVHLGHETTLIEALTPSRQLLFYFSWPCSIFPFPLHPTPLATAHGFYT